MKTYTFIISNIKSNINHNALIQQLIENSFDESALVSFAATNNDTFEIVTNRELTQQEQDDIQESLNSHNFLNIKTSKLAAIDLKSQELILQGFIFDNTKFSLSDKAQFNWNAILASIQSGILTEANFPFEISTYDNGVYELAWSDVNTFMSLALQTVTIHLATGRGLKQQVNAATTVEEVEAIIDNRT